MFRSLWLLVAAAFLLSCPLVAQGQSQAEMNAEAADSLRQADARLNQVYRHLLKERASDPEFLADLKEAQRAWLRYVDFHLKTVFPLKKGENPREVYGSIHPLEVAEARTALIEQRIEQLKLLVE